MAQTTAPAEPPERHLRAVRRLPLPQSQPPYDDEIGAEPPGPERRRRVSGGHPGPVQGTLALDAPFDARAAPRPQLRLVPEHEHADHRPAALPDPRRWTAKLAQAAIESLAGRRPLQQLTRWTDEAVYRALVRRAASRATTSLIRPQVRSIRICEVNDTVAEASIVLQYGPRASAVAVRLEAADGRWLCTAFDFVEASQPLSR